MKTKQKKSAKHLLSDKIADALTVKPKADIEDDQVFGTKPQTLTKTDLGSSDSEDEAAISDFRKRNINLLSEVNKKYEGQVVSRKELKKDNSEDYEESDSEDEGTYLTAKDISIYDEDSDGSNDLETEKYPQPPTTSQQKPKATSGSEDLSSEGESDDYSITKFKKQIEGSDGDEDEEQDNEESEGEEDDEGYDISQMDEPMRENFEHVKKQNISEEAKKGACVRNQLLIWEGLLEMRIHLQRCMNTVNQMPMPDTYKELKQNNKFTEECNIAKTNIATVLDKFLTLQNMLFKNNPETKTISNKVEGKDTQLENTNSTTKLDDDDEEIPSDTDNEEIPSDTDAEDEDTAKKDTSKKPANATLAKKRKLEDYENDISRSYKAFKSFRDSTIQKWNEKTRLAAASNIKNKNAPTNTILQQISYILSDKEKLVKRTQLKRSEYDIIGYKKETIEEESEQNGTEVPKVKDRKDDDEYIPEIFDDSDFYHQLLRELIECKSADISDPVQLSRQWIALQQMRSKMKRKVDTKATKGRKIKYVVHNKLVNYMAPEKCTTWNEESTNELYSSLFGKMFEHNNVGLNANLENGFKVKN